MTSHEPNALRSLVRGRIPLVAALALALAEPAAAYVVVTSDNRVFQVPVKPEVRADMVLFTIDGVPVSLRVYEVNVAKTNEMNYLMDSGASATTVLQQARMMPSANPADERVIVASRMHQVLETEATQLPGAEAAGGAPQFSFSPDRPGRREPPGPAPMASFGDRERRRSQAEESRFAAEARRAMTDAQRQMSQPPPPPPPPVMAPQAPPPAAVPRRNDRAAELDAEIAAEQAYLRQLTSGEATADDLDREITKTMEKIRRLQKRRQNVSSEPAVDVAAAADATIEPAAAYQPSGQYPAGSREAKWEQELATATARLERLRQQQAALGDEPSDEREVLDELIGETEYSIQRLQNRLDRAR